jgi:hypothetical protein
VSQQKTIDEVVNADTINHSNPAVRNWYRKGILAGLQMAAELCQKQADAEKAHFHSTNTSGALARHYANLQCRNAILALVAEGGV